jgi:hypothetical protein
LTVPASVLQPSNRLTPGPARVMQIRISEYSVELPRNIPLRLGGIPSKN